MNKGELISHVADQASITKNQAAEAVNAVFQGIESSLKGGDKAAFIGFGTFSVNNRPARQGINPATKEKIQIAAKNVIKFKAGKALQESVN